MPPVTTDPRGRLSTSEPALALATDRVPLFDTADLFGDASERTQISSPFDLRPRFTGRGDALGRLLRGFDQAADHRQLSFLIVLGEAGMGKSRLLRELADAPSVQNRGSRVLFGSADDPDVAHQAIGRLLAQRFGIAPGTSAEDSRARIEAGVAAILQASRATDVTHLLAHLMRVGYPDSPVVGPLVESPQRLESRIFLALRRFLAADAEAQPLVLVIENLEHSGAETVNLVHYLAAGLRSSPVQLIATGTAALFERHPSFGEGDVAADRVTLGPLSTTDAEALVRELLRPLDQIPDQVVAHAKSLGSPRAIHELVRLLLESEVIHREGAMWRLVPDRLAATRLPQSYQELVSARLAVMDAGERRVLEMAAAIGETFWLDAVVCLERTDAGAADAPDGPALSHIAELGDHDRLATAAALTKLVERDWLVEVRESSVRGEREYRFAYPNLWALVHATIDAAQLKRYHAATARWLELRPEGRGADALEEIAKHFEEAGELRDASQRYRRAAVAARTGYQNERAVRFYERALACLGGGDVATRIHLWHDLGSVQEAAGDVEAALGAFERMLRLSWITASKTKAAVAFNKMGRVWRRKGDLKLALEYLERGAELFRTGHDLRGIAASLDDIGKVLLMQGKVDDAFEKITAALALRGKGGDKRSIAHSLSNLGNVQHDRGNFDAAYNCHREALELRREGGDRSGVVISQNNLAALSFELGDYADAKALWQKALADATSIGVLPLASLVLVNLGELALAEGKLEEAQRRLEDALEIIVDTEDRQLEAACCRNLALVESQGGRPQSARIYGERALKIAADAGLREKEAQAHVTMGRILSSSLFDAERTEYDGGTGPAETHFRRAIELLRGLGGALELGKALEAYGRFSIEAGKPAQGRELLREAYGIFTRLGMKRREQIEALLATLS